MATVKDAKGGQRVLQWGEEKYGNVKVGITWGNYLGNVVLIGPDDREERYPFAIISRSMPERPEIPVILSPQL